MNIFRTKVREVKTIYTKVTDITILGQIFELKVAYKNVKVTELNFENREVKVILPLKFRNKDIRKILNIITNKMYEQIAKKEVETIMEKIRSKLKFAPEDYKIEFIKKRADNDLLCHYIAIILIYSLLSIILYIF